MHFKHGTRTGHTGLAQLLPPVFLKDSCFTLYNLAHRTLLPRPKPYLPGEKKTGNVGPNKTALFTDSQPM